MIIWKNVKINFINLILWPVPATFRNWLSERVANMLPKRVVGWCLFRACRHYEMNQHITLFQACKKFSKQGRRGSE